VVARAQHRRSWATAARRPDLTGGIDIGRSPATARPARQTVLQGDRLKAYRPLAAEARHAALEAGLTAYTRGDFFEAHELLEPAWMGTADLAERALYQGLIKLAAGYVHAVRGNPIGMAKNLEGSRRHLVTSQQLDSRQAEAVGIDLGSLIAEVDSRLVAARAVGERIVSNPAIVVQLAEDAPPIRSRLAG
jgi:hypothetical protein